MKELIQKLMDKYATKGGHNLVAVWEVRQDLHELKQSINVVEAHDERSEANEKVCEHDYKLEISAFFEDRFVCAKCGDSHL